MSATLHRLTGAGPVLEPEPAVIDMLKELLSLAESGAIKGAGVFYVDGADGVSTDWAPGCARQSLMVAGAAKLSHRVLKAATDE